MKASDLIAELQKHVDAGDDRDVHCYFCDSFITGPVALVTPAHGRYPGSDPVLILSPMTE